MTPSESSCRQQTTYWQYCYDILNDKIPAGKYIKLACLRALDWFEASKQPDNQFEFREEKVEKVLRFCSKLKHYQGKWAGTHWIVEPWQQFIISQIMGWYLKGTNQRRISNVLLHVSRKNGKSYLASALAMYNCIEEAGAQAICAANSRDQAAILYETCQEFAKQMDRTGKKIKALHSTVRFKKNASKIKVVSRDTSKLDGFSPSLALIDEIEEAPDTKMRDVMESGMGARESSCIIQIFTAGFNLEYPAYESVQVAQEVLEGIKTDDSSLYFLYTHDPDDFDEETGFPRRETWQKSNPNLGVSAITHKLELEVQKAINQRSKLTGVLTKNFNCWCNGDLGSVWIPRADILNCMADYDVDVIKKLDIFVYGGLDLSSVSDLTSGCYLWFNENDRKFYTKFYNWLPPAALRGEFNVDFYRRMIQTKDLILTDQRVSNVVDYDEITLQVKHDMSDGVQLYKLAVDPYNASQWQIQAQKEGIPVQLMNQNMMNLSPASKMLERLVKQQQIVFQKSELLLWAFSNCVIKEDLNFNQRVFKKDGQYKNKIDPVVALLNALAIWLQTPHSDGVLVG